jgi:hypothetical protein
VAKSPARKKPANSTVKKPPSVENNERESAPAKTDPWKSKLIDAVRFYIDLRIPRHRLLEKARIDADIEVIRAEGRARAQAVLDGRGDNSLNLAERSDVRRKAVEVRQQSNIETVIAEAAEALSASDEAISTEPISEDFVHRLFDDCKNIGDKEMQTLWGRILAGEIARPGSFHPKTLGVVKDLTKADATLFVQLCRFGFSIDEFRIVAFDYSHASIKQNGLEFDTLAHLDDLGLIKFQPGTSYIVESLPNIFDIVYGKKLFKASKPQGIDLPFGGILLSAAGKQLAPLTNAEAVPGYIDHAISYWKRNHITVTLA